MRIADLLRRDQNSIAGLREAIVRAEAAGQDAAARLERLTAERTTALLADDDKGLDRIEAGLTQAHRDADRADLAVFELRKRLGEAEAAEEKARRDALHARAQAAQRRGVELIAQRYAKLAVQMVKVIEELEEAEGEIRDCNAQLAAVGDGRLSDSADYTARPRWNNGDYGASRFFAVLCLPHPTIAMGTLYPPCDLVTAAVRRASDGRETPLQDRQDWKSAA